MFDLLATQDQLGDRGITVPASMDADTLLRAASDAVRDAAGCPITVTTATVTLVVTDSCTPINLPGGPVSNVAAVTVDSVPVVGWRKVGSAVLMPSGWASLLVLPLEVQVTYTVGYPYVPEDIVDLVCGMASIAAAANGQYGLQGRSDLIKLGDYEERFSHPAGTDSPSPVAVPDSVRQRLRARFGTSVAMVG